MNARSFIPMLVLTLAVAMSSVRPGFVRHHAHCTDADPLHPHGVHVDDDHHHHGHDHHHHHEHRHGDVVHSHAHHHHPGETHDEDDPNHDHCVFDPCPDTPTVAWTPPTRTVIDAPPLSTVLTAFSPGVSDWRMRTRAKPPPGGRDHPADAPPTMTTVLRL